MNFYSSKTVLLLLVAACIGAGQLYDSNLYSLGSNIIINPSFSSPILPSGTISKMYNRLGITGWTCRIKCRLTDIPNTCLQMGLSCNTSYTQAMGLISMGTMEDVSQQVIVATTAQYLLSVEWMIPFLNPVGKSFEIFINGVSFSNITVISSQYANRLNQYVMNLTAGLNIITFRMIGTWNTDAQGIDIAGVNIQQLILKPISLNQTGNSTTNTTNLTATVNSTNSTVNASNYTVNTTNSSINGSNSINSNQTLNNSTTNNTNQPTASGQSSLGSEDFNVDGFSYLTTVQTQNSFLMNQLTLILNKIPGNRIFLFTLTNFMLTFDRLQFYYFHRQNLTQYSEMLLSNVNKLAIDRGSLLQNFFESCELSFCVSLNNFYTDLVAGLDYKYKYTESFFLGRNSQGFGFFANNMDFFYYELPAIFISYIIFSMLFRALFNYPISRFIRKYSFSGILLFLVYEGNIQQFAFYFFTECRNLFSFNFAHKLANVMMLYFFFILMVFGVGGLVWFTFHYRKLVKYFLEDSKISSLKAVSFEALERAIYPLIFGSLHALLIDHLLIQTIALGIIESCYFFAKVYTLKSVIPRYKFKITLLMIASLLRIGFILTFYLFQTMNQPPVINRIHHDMVGLYLICWAIEFTHDSIVLIKECGSAIKTIFCPGAGKQTKDKNPQSLGNKVKQILVPILDFATSHFKKKKHTTSNIQQTQQDVKKEKKEKGSLTGVQKKGNVLKTLFRRKKKVGFDIEGHDPNDGARNSHLKITTIRVEGPDGKELIPQIFIKSKVRKS